MNTIIMGVGGRSAIMITNLLVLMVTSRLLAPDDFGRFAIALLAIDLAGAAAYAVIGIPMLQARRFRSADYSNAFTLQLIIGLSTGALLFGSAGMLEHWLRMPGLSSLLQVAALVLPIRCANGFFIAMLQRQSKVGILIWAQTRSQIIAAFGVTLILAGLGFGAWSLLLGLIVAAVLEMSWYVASTRFRLKIRLTRKSAELVRNGLVPLANRMLNFGSDSIDRLVIGSRFGAADLGIYTRASSLVLIPANLIGLPLQNVLISWFSRINRGTSPVAEALNVALAIESLLVIPATVGLWIASPLLVRLVLGEQWLAAIPFAQVLFVGVMARLAASPFEAAALALGYAKGAMKRQIASTAVLITGLVAAIGHSLVWVAVAVSVSRVVYYALTIRFVVITFKSSWRPILAAHAKSLILLGVGISAAWLSLHVINTQWRTANELLMIGSYIVGCGALLFLGPNWLVAPTGPLASRYVVGLGKRIFS